MTTMMDRDTLLIENADLKAKIKEQGLKLEELEDYKDRYIQSKADSGEGFAASIA